MEKLKEMFGKWGKDRFAILIIGGLLILVVCIPLPNSGEKSNDVLITTEKEMTNNSKQRADSQEFQLNNTNIIEFNAYETQLENKLKNKLTLIDGAGKVEVMVSLMDSGAYQIEKDLSYERINDESKDTTQVTASQINVNNTEETVYTVNEDGDNVPFVKRFQMPQIEGIVVIVQGGGNSMVSSEIKQSIKALFGIEEHKIKVVKMKGEEI